MSRTTWVTSLVFVAIACAAVISSCHYDIHNTCSPEVACCGKGRPCQGTKQPPHPVKDIVAIRRGEVPNAFFVAVDAKGKCADIAGDRGRWAGRVLLPRGDSGAHCAYVWHGESLAAAPDERPFKEPLRVGLESAELDPPAMDIQQAQPEPEPEPAPGDDAQDMNAWLTDRYQAVRDRLGEPLESDRPAQTANVRVAVVDSASGNFYAGAEDPVGHGRAVGRLIEDVACKGESLCRVELKNYGALPLMTSAKGTLQTNGTGAAAYGTRGFLAEQIEKAVSDWQNEVDAGAGPDHLVVNLSLGWSGCWNAKDAQPKNDPVYQAILRASCQGAMVVAAGGNIEAVPGCPAGSPGQGTTGEHVFPARFLNHSSRPDAATCQEVGIQVQNAAALGPLLLGISAVDENDEQLVVAEQESSLVAFGNAVVVPDGDAWTRQLSGTSMSAATVSGIAAAVWAAFPARSAAELERDLIEPAVLLRGRADPAPFICNALPQPLAQSECQNVRRASLCRSLAHAGGMSSECGPPKAMVEPSNPNSLLASSSRSAVAPNAVAADAEPDPEVGQQCVPNTASAANCPQPGPDAIDSTEQPWAVVGPQPTGNSCGTCQYTKSSHVFKGVFRSGTISSAKPGWVSLSTGDFDLWSSSMTSMSISKTLSGAGSATKGKLWYTQSSSMGPIYYYETVVIK